MATYTEKYTFGDIVRRELSQDYCREAVTVASGENLPLCAVVGKQLFDCPTEGTEDGDNTGDGTLTLANGGKDSKVGTYTVTCITAVENGGVFTVVDPDGNRLMDAAVDVAYDTSQIGFMLSAGDVDFVIGDIFTVEIAEGDGKVVFIDPDATDGSQIAAGITVAAYDATVGDLKGALVIRDAVIVARLLAWPVDMTEDEKTAALAQLAARGIKNREGA